MRLPLDWDSEALKEMHLPAVLDRQPAQDNQQTLAQYVENELGTGIDHTGKWELWTSSNHQNAEEGEGGYHYVEYGLDAGLEDLRKLRTSYGDDRLRIALDGKRMQWGSPFVNVMYHMKNIKPHEHKPYETPNRAQLLERHGFDGDTVISKNHDGTLNYPNLIEALAEHEDFGSRAALFRRIQRRGSVTVSTDPSKRAYDLVNARRKPTRNEAKAIRDYAESREIGHYGEQDGVPEELAAKPTRTTFHEYFEMPEIEFDAGDFGEGDDDSDSEWYPANIRTGTYGDVDEMTVKQVHDNLVPEILEMLSPGHYQETDDGKKYYGVELSRWDYAISLERDRPLDRDEKARYRRIVMQNQPGRAEETTRKYATRDGDPFDGDAVLWEVVVYDGEDALKANGRTNYWWIARGVTHVDEDGVHDPLRNSTIIADTEGWL